MTRSFGGRLPQVPRFLPIAVILQVANRDACRLLPDGPHRGFSAASILPVFLLAFWGIAELVGYLAASFWGTTILGSCYVIITIVVLGCDTLLLIAN
jgi:hypothetical protein